MGEPQLRAVLFDREIDAATIAMMPRRMGSGSSGQVSISSASSVAKLGYKSCRAPNSAPAVSELAVFLQFCGGCSDPARSFHFYGIKMPKWP